MKTLYDKLHDAIIKATGLKVGDTVKVLRKAESYELGWKTCWVSMMNPSVGKEYKVRKIDSFGATLNDGHFFPLHILEIVKRGVELPVFYLKDGYEVKVQEDGSLVVGCQTVSNDLLNKITDAANKVKG